MSDSVIVAPEVLNPGDPLFSKVAFLCSFDGAHDSNVFFDKSQYSHTITAVNEAKLTTASKKFGTAALTLDGSNDSATVANHASLVIGTKEFCIEGWVNNSASAAALDVLFAKGNSGAFVDGQWAVGIDNSTQQLYFRYSAGSAARMANGIVDGTWQHVMVSRQIVEGVGYLRMGIDGVIQSEASGPAWATLNLSTTQALNIGVGPGGSWFNGLLDEWRVTVEDPRYIGNYPVPTEPFKAN